MINDRIATYYDNGDAKFKTRETSLYSTSALQKTGVCMQSKTYERTAVTLSYELSSNGSISEVKFGPALGGCKK